MKTYTQLTSELFEDQTGLCEGSRGYKRTQRRIQNFKPTPQDVLTNTLDKKIKSELVQRPKDFKNKNIQRVKKKPYGDVDGSYEMGKNVAKVERSASEHPIAKRIGMAVRSLRGMPLGQNYSNN